MKFHFLIGLHQAWGETHVQHVFHKATPINDVCNWLIMPKQQPINGQGFVLADGRATNLMKAVVG